MTGRYIPQAHWLGWLLTFAYMNRQWLARGYSARSEAIAMSLFKEGTSP